MSLVYIITDGEVFALDATSTISSTTSNEVTEYPVESGYSITKGVLSKSDTFSVSGVISDTHIRNTSPNRSSEVLSELTRIKDERRIVTLVEKGSSYSNLVITAVNASESSTAGFSKSVDINLKQVRIASSASTSVPYNELDTEVADTADGKSNGGVRPKTATGESTIYDLRERYNQGVDALVSLFSDSEEGDAE